MTTTTSQLDALRARAQRLGLHGLISEWSELGEQAWVERLIAVEEVERQKRSLDARIKKARFGRFKPMADFDWKWPTKIDREGIEELFNLDFLADGANVILLGPNGTGKTMIGRNLAHRAVLRGETVLFTTASEMLNDLAAQTSGAALTRRLKRYTTPRLLHIDEVGYLSYDARHADLLFEVVTRRYEQRSIVLTTNKAFAEWSEVFPNAACVVTLVDRLIHRSEILAIEGESYRLKEAKERTNQKAAARKSKNRDGKKKR